MLCIIEQAEQGHQKEQEEGSVIGGHEGADGTVDGEWLDAPPSFTCPISVRRLVGCGH